LKFSKNELAALPRLFSASVLTELGKRGESPLFSRLVRQTRFGIDDPDLSVRDTFESAFDALTQLGVRDEYVYKTAITQKLFLGRHSLNTATSLSEVRAGECKADLVVLNGTSTAYEIKSERDSLTRLTNQVNHYRRVFAAVNVVCGPIHVSQVLDIVPIDVGVLALSNRFTFQVVREAAISPERTSTLAILNSLRSTEAVSILESLGVEVPAVPNTKKRALLEDLFADLDSHRVHDEMVRTLRRTRSHKEQADFLGSVPRSLRAAVLSRRTSEAQRGRITRALDTSLPAALAWN
jgi:hypothetical protein